MSLNHVSLWENGKWRNTTYEEVKRLHNKGKISASSGILRCDLCGQYIILTEEKVRESYFKHSRGEENKDCPDRAGQTIIYDVDSFCREHQNHHLPLRLKINSNSTFSLEIGFISLPQNLFEKHSRNNYIQIRNKEGLCCRYSISERINELGITYLSVDSDLSDIYRISTRFGFEELSKYWPKEIKGVQSGTLFDSHIEQSKNTLFKNESTVYAKKLPIDSDIKINRIYYLLSKQKIDLFGKSICIKLIAQKSISRKIWYLYELVVNEIDAFSVGFFTKYNYRLTEYPINVYPMWPVCVQTPYRILHNSSYMNMLFESEDTSANALIFPEKHISYNTKRNLISFSCYDREQMMSVGRTKVLKYFYLWKNPLDYYNEISSVEVINKNGEIIKEGESNLLPPDKILYVTAPFDGDIVIEKENMIIDKHELKSKNKKTLSDICFGIKISIYQGLDCVWQISFIKEKRDILNNNGKISDNELLKKLKISNGRRVNVTHSLGVMASKMKAYPKVKCWFNKQIRQGYMYDRALILLKSFFL